MAYSKKRKYLIPEGQTTFNQMLRDNSRKHSAARKRVVRTLDRLQLLLDRVDDSSAGQISSKFIQGVESSSLAQAIGNTQDRLRIALSNSYYDRKTKSYGTTSEELVTEASNARSEFETELSELTRENRKVASRKALNTRITKKFAKSISDSYTATEADTIDAADAYYGHAYDNEQDKLIARDRYETAVHDITKRYDVSIFYQQTQRIWQLKDPARRNEIIVDYLKNLGCRLDNGKLVENLEDAWQFYHEEHIITGNVKTNPEMFAKNTRYWKLVYKPSSTWSDSDDAFMDEYADVTPYEENVRL